MGIDYHIVVIYFALTSVILLGTGLILFVPSRKKAAKLKSAGNEPEQKKKISKLCLAGLILSALYPVLQGISYIVFRSLNFPYDDIDLYYSWSSSVDAVEMKVNTFLLLLPVAGIILSIVGLITLSRRGLTGKKFAIAGIILPFVYLSIVLLMVIAFIVFAVVGQGTYVRPSFNYGITEMGYVGKPENTEYDVSKYRIPEGFDFDTLNVNTSEAELKLYAENKLQTLGSVNYMSTKGKFQNSDFLIVRSDCLDKLLSNGKLGSFSFSKGYATLDYDYEWEIAAHVTYTLDVYKDPSDKYIIITNCSDYKVIAEFFEGIGNAVPTEATDITYETVNETNDPAVVRIFEMEYYLEDHIYEETLPEIIDVFKQMCEEFPGEDTLIFKYGVDHFDEYDMESRTTDYFGICLIREYKADNGKTYQIRVEVLYGLTAKSRSFDLTQVTNKEVDGDFYEYIKNSDAYKYALTAKIKKVRIHSVEV